MRFVFGLYWHLFMHWLSKNRMWFRVTIFVGEKKSFVRQCCVLHILPLMFVFLFFIFGNNKMIALLYVVWFQQQCSCHCICFCTKMSLLLLCEALYIITWGLFMLCALNAIWCLAGLSRGSVYLDDITLACSYWMCAFWFCMNVWIILLLYICICDLLWCIVCCSYRVWFYSDVYIVSTWRSFFTFVCMNVCFLCFSYVCVSFDVRSAVVITFDSMRTYTLWVYEDFFFFCVYGGMCLAWCTVCGSYHIWFYVDVYIVGTWRFLLLLYVWMCVLCLVWITYLALTFQLYNTLLLALVTLNSHIYLSFYMFFFSTYR